MHPKTSAFAAQHTVNNAAVVESRAPSSGYTMNQCEIRAAQTETTVRVYQAFSPAIAEPALLAGTFVPPFLMTRMTWIKPSFNWMMHRSGYASKPGQEVVLAIEITKSGLIWALEHATLAAFDAAIHPSVEFWRSTLQSHCVRVQWDPGRSHSGQTLPHMRTIQIGLSGEAVARYTRDWIVSIEDVTPVARSLATALRAGDSPATLPHLDERVIALDGRLRARICPH